MEKYAHQIGEDQRRTISRADQFYKDNASFRQIMAIRVDSAVTDEQDTDKPLWRGDHTFSADAAKYSLLNFIEPEIEAEHPEWSKSEIRKTALARFEHRLAQDLSYEQKETAHVESAVHWRVIETAPGHKELATDYGGETVTLKKLWDHTREYAAFVGNANAYNPEEEKAQLAMEQAFITGDSHAYVSVLSHPDAVRYVQVWERGVDGDIQSKQIDLYASTGRDFSNSEGEQLIRQLAQYQEEIHGVEIIKSEAQYTHFMVKDGQVMEQDIRTIAILGSAFEETEAVQYQSVTQGRVIGVPQKIVQEGWTALSDLTRYVSEEIGKTVDALRRPHTKTLPPGGISRQPEPIAQPKQNSESLTIADVKEQAVNTKTTPVDMSPVTPDHQASDTDTSMKSVLTEWVISKTILSYARLQPEAAGAAIFWMSYVTETTRLLAKQANVEDGKSLVALEVRKRLFHLRDVIYRKVTGHTLRLERPKKHHTERKKNTSIDLDAPSDVSTVSKSRAGERSVARMWKRIETTALVMQVRTLMRDISQKIWGKPPEIKTNAPVPSVARETRPDSVIVSKEKDAPFSMVEFAILYWILLSYKQKEIRIYTRSLEKQHAHSPKGRESSVMVKSRKNNAGSAIKEVSSPWVLLSIIWYLVMIRESASAGSAGYIGASSSVSPQVTLGKQPVFPQSGIIYIFLQSDSANVHEAFVIE